MDRQSMTRPDEGLPGAGQGRLLGLMLLLCAANAAFWLPQLVQVLTGLAGSDPQPAFANRDMANYWLAGKLALAGDVTPLFRQETHQAALEAAFGLQGMEIRNWSYPPPFLFVVLPLGLMPYPAAYAVFLLATGGWFLWTVRSLVRNRDGDGSGSGFGLVAALLLPFLVLQVIAGQNGFFFGAAFLQALLWRGSRPMAAGLMIALLTLKPQLGILVPVLLLAERRFAAIIWAAIFAALLAGLSLLVFGPGIWRAFFADTLPYQRLVASHWEGLFLTMMPTWFAALRALGISADLALALHLALTLPLGLAALAALWRAPDDWTRARLVLAATFVLTPYAFNYDLGALLAMIAASLAAGRRTDGWTAAGGALVMALPLWTPLAGRPDVLLVTPPLVMSGLLGVLVLDVFRPGWSLALGRKVMS